MKKRTEISLRTKIYLTIVGLLSLVAGTVYGASPFFFAPLNEATGIAISPTTLYATQWCGQGLFGFDCTGQQTLLGLIPLGREQCTEKYMSIAPTLSTAAGFTPGDLFITEGAFVFKFTPPAGPITLFKDLTGLGTGACQFADHSSIKFDKTGTFGFRMIFTCEGGDVGAIDGSGNATLIGTFSGHGHDPVHIEGQEVAAATFGPLAGMLLVVDENTQSINAMDASGNVTFNVFNWTGNPPYGMGVENIRNIPTNVGTCTFGCIANQPIGAFFQQVEDLGFTLYYPPTDFLTGGLNDGRHVLVTSEANPPTTTQGTLLVAFNPITNSYDTSVFDASFNFTINEGAQFVECPEPTPTSTPTNTPTPTPTSTPTATFTPTPTATFTPTPTATSTPTPTPTPTSTPGGVCPLTQGYWKNHSNAWPVNSLVLGSQTYSKAELLNILNTPVGGDASLNLAHQLIAAKLNIAAGSDPTPISSTIAHADNLLSMFSGKLPYHVASSSTIGQMMVSDANTLDNYNNGQLTPHCSGQRGQPEQQARPAPRPR